MSQNQKKKSRKNSKSEQLAPATSATAEREVEVLYQRIGQRWFAFSVIDDEVYMGSIPDDSVEGGKPFLNDLK